MLSFDEFCEKIEENGCYSVYPDELCNIGFYWYRLTVYERDTITNPREYCRFEVTMFSGEPKLVTNTGCSIISLDNAYVHYCYLANSTIIERY